MVKRTRATTEEQILDRKLEIINSCYQVYLEKGFKDTSIKDISLKLSFARSSIYNYYQTKEEIFLDLLRIEYNNLNEDLMSIYENEKLSNEELARLISLMVSKRTVLLQIISSSLNDLEKESRIDFLVDFKVSYGKTINTVRDLVSKYTNLNGHQIDKFVELFFPFLFGLCAFTIVSPRQLEAMEKANINWISRTTQELCYDFIIEFLNK